MEMSALTYVLRMQANTLLYTVSQVGVEGCEVVCLFKVYNWYKHNI